MKHNVRILVSVLTTLVMIFSFSVPGYAGTKEAVHISVGGQQLAVDAVERENTIFLPLRAVSESLGYSVEWTNADRSVTVKTDDKTVLFEPKAGTITDDGHNYYVLRNYISDFYIGAGCMQIGGRYFVASDIMEDCFGLSKTFDDKQNAFVLTLRPEGKATSENKRIYSEDKKLTTRIQYPYFTMADKAVAEKINAVILADVNLAQQEARDNLKANEGYESPNRFETYFNYRIVYQDGDYLSVVLNDYQYYGGAHGSDRQISHTFDLKTGSEYNLADLMKNNSGYMDYISKRVKADIVKDGMEDAQLIKFESIADNQSYYLSNNGLIVYFQQYEYFPYAAGIMEYTTPYADLKEYLMPNFQGLGEVN